MSNNNTLCIYLLTLYFTRRTACRLIGRRNTKWRLSSSRRCGPNSRTEESRRRRRRRGALSPRTDFSIIAWGSKRCWLRWPNPWVYIYIHDTYTIYIHTRYIYLHTHSIYIYTYIHTVYVYTIQIVYNIYIRIHGHAHNITVVYAVPVCIASVRLYTTAMSVKAGSGAPRISRLPSYSQSAISLGRCSSPPPPRSFRVAYSLKTPKGNCMDSRHDAVPGFRSCPATTIGGREKYKYT